MLHRLRRLVSTVSHSAHGTEVDHWKAIEARAATGERIFWLNHPRVRHHYDRKSMFGGLHWRGYVQQQFGGPAMRALELGCGDGQALGRLVDHGVIASGAGLDLDESRFVVDRHDGKIGFITADVNSVTFEPESYDLVFALQAFHHFEAVEHVMAQAHRALKPGGLIVLEEFVGPSRFQWTDVQLAWVGHLLDLMPSELRRYPDGTLKRREGRSTPEAVIRVCPSEAVRPADIPQAFRDTFDPVAALNLGGTVQHLLYSGIIQNFPDNDPATDALIDSVDAIETALIGSTLLPSDFMLLIGRRRN